jgi:small subunit ribosomal protein S17
MAKNLIKKEKIHKSIIVGNVVSDKMEKTVIIEISRFKQHPKYSKVYKVSKRIKIHDEKNEAKVGDLIEAESSRPRSRQKSFILKRILKVIHD